MRVSAVSLIAILVYGLTPPAAAHGDGGLLRISEQKGDYRITVFTAPTPVRAGPVDVSVLVQNATSGEMVPAAHVEVAAGRRGAPDEPIWQTATTDLATNKLLCAAVFELPRPGVWEITVAIDGPLGKANTAFVLDAEEPAPPWIALFPWIGWPAFAILAFSVHHWLAARQAGRRQAGKTA